VAGGRLWNAIGEKSKTIAFVELKGLFEKDRCGIHSERERWCAGEFLTVQVRREMAGIGESAVCGRSTRRVSEMFPGCNAATAIRRCDAGGRAAVWKTADRSRVEIIGK
jgi:hypothetical protein